MSYYRDDREAARRRIEALESELRQRESELAAQRADLAARGEEISRLRDEVEHARGGLPRRGIVSLTTIWAARSVGLALLMCSAMGGAGFFMSSPHPTADRNFDDEHLAIVDMPDVPAFGAMPLYATAPPPQATRDLDEHVLMKSLEQKAWSGHASVDELRTLAALCSYFGDLECKVRASSLLPPNDLR